MSQYSELPLAPHFPSVRRAACAWPLVLGFGFIRPGSTGLLKILSRMIHSVDRSLEITGSILYPTRGVVIKLPFRPSAEEKLGREASGKKCGKSSRQQ